MVTNITDMILIKWRSSPFSSLGDYIEKLSQIDSSIESTAKHPDVTLTDYFYGYI